MTTESLPPPRWLEQLQQVLERMGVPVRSIVLTQGVLHIELNAGDGILSAEIKPLRDGVRGFAATRRFVFGYRGRGDLAPADKRRLELLVGVFQRIESRLPRDLDGIGGLFAAPISPETRFLRLFPFCTVERSHAGTQTITELLVRTTPACNQRCPFCTAPDTIAPTHSTVRALLQEAARVFPQAMLSLTGGEPTLRKTFLEEVRIACSLGGIGSVQVQTNAVGFASKIDPEQLERSPKLSFFVSLHALDEAIYDVCTGTQGQLELALAGLNRLIEAGHQVTINCVVNKANLEHLGEYVRRLPEVVPMHNRVDLHFSTLICPESRPEAAAFLVRYGDLAERLREAVDAAGRLGIAVQSLRASTHAAMPACMLDPEERSRDPHRPEVLAHETGRLEEGRLWVRAACCDGCVEQRHCLGVPRPYALRFGLDELRPIRRT